MAYKRGLGTVIQLNYNSSFNDLAQVVNIGPPKLANPSVDVTHLGSSWREKLPTIPDGGTVTANIEWDPGHATHNRLTTNTIASTSPESWKIIFPTTTQTVTFSGVLTGFEPADVQVDDVLRASITIDVTGAVTIST